MNGTEHLRQTLEYYRQQLQKKLEELSPLQLMIRQLERELGESTNAPEITEPNGNTTLSAQTFAGFGVNRNIEVRPDDFYGMSQSEAAKAYLLKIGRAVSLDELVSALNKGGARVGGASPKKTLYVGLMRNPMREFVSPSENHIGLRSFYPGLPKVERAAAKPSAKKSKTKKKSRAAKKTKRPNPPKAPDLQTVEEPKKHPMKETVHEILGASQPQTADEIFKAVEQKLGKVPKIAVLGALRGKEFELVDDKYSLAK
jgi:hypothetical protein